MKVDRSPSAASGRRVASVWQMRFSTLVSVNLRRNRQTRWLPALAAALAGIALAGAETPPAAREGYVGVVVAAEVVDLAAEVAGRLVSVAVRVGDRVKPGQELGRIEPLELPSQIVGAEAAV